MKRTWILVLLSGAFLITIGMGFRQSFGLFLPPISEQIGAGRELFALAIALQNIVWGASSPFFGALADRFGAAIVASVGGFFYALGLVIMSQADSGTAVLSGQAMVGLGMGGVGFSVILGAVARAVPDEKRSLALGIVSAGGSVGQFLLVPGAEYLWARFGLEDALMLMGIISLTMVGVAFGLRGNVEEAAAFRAASRQTAREALVEALQHKGYILLTLGFFVCGFQVVFIATHIPAFLADKGIEPHYAALSLSLVGLFNIFGSLGAGWVGGRYSKRSSLAVLYSARSLVIIAFLVLPISGPSAVVFGAAIGLFWLGTIPLTSGLIGVFFGTRHMSMLYGVVFFSHQLGSFLGAWLGGRLYDELGNYDLMWTLMILSGFLASLLHVMIKEAPVPRLAEAKA